MLFFCRTACWKDMYFLFVSLSPFVTHLKWEKHWFVQIHCKAMINTFVIKQRKAGGGSFLMAEEQWHKRTFSYNMEFWNESKLGASKKMYLLQKKKRSICELTCLSKNKSQCKCLKWSQLWSVSQGDEKGTLDQYCFHFSVLSITAEQTGCAFYCCAFLCFGIHGLVFLLRCIMKSIGSHSERAGQLWSLLNILHWSGDLKLFLLALQFSFLVEL